MTRQALTRILAHKSFISNDLKIPRHVVLCTEKIKLVLLILPPPSHLKIYFHYKVRSHLRHVHATLTPR
jgi:hypothetical protein